MKLPFNIPGSTSGLSIIAVVVLCNTVSAAITCVDLTVPVNVTAVSYTAF